MLRRLLRSVAFVGLLCTAARGMAQVPEGAVTRPSDPVAPQLQPRSGRVLTLARCLELASQNYPRVQEARARLVRKQGQLAEARALPLSEFSVNAGLGPAPTVYGSQIYSPNTQVSLTSNMALAWQVNFQGVVPLWTFGKLGAVWEAAAADVTVSEHEVKKSVDEVKLDVKRAFFGLQLARDSRALVKESEEKVDEFLGRMEREVARGKGDDIELLKTKMFRADLEVKELQATKGEVQAMAGLRFLIGAQGVFDIPRDPLRRSKHELGPLPRYLEAARLFRAEVNMARAGIVARKAQVDLQRARFYPDVGLGLSLSWKRAPEVADQLNPFIGDPNGFGYGAGIVLRWNLDFLSGAARLAQAEAQLDEMRATERYALGGVAVEVESAFAEALEARKRLDAFDRSTSYARRWMVKVQQGIDVGTMDDKDLVDPAREYATRRFGRMQAIYDYNIAVGKLAVTTGWERVGDQ